MFGQKTCSFNALNQRPKEHAVLGSCPGQIWGRCAIYVGIPSQILANEWELSHLCPKKAAWFDVEATFFWHRWRNSRFWAIYSWGEYYRLAFKKTMLVFLLDTTSTFTSIGSLVLSKPPFKIDSAVPIQLCMCGSPSEGIAYHRQRTGKTHVALCSSWSMTDGVQTLKDLATDQLETHTCCFQLVSWVIMWKISCQASGSVIDCGFGMAVSGVFKMSWFNQFRIGS